MHFALILLSLSALAETSRAPSALVPESRVVVLGSPSDERLEVVRAALEFWESVFAELRLEYPFAGMSFDSGSPRRSLETYARSLSQQAGRNGSGAGPPAPDTLLDQTAEIVVLLSRQKLMPFAWPLQQDGPRYFVALPAGADLEIAKHELGHTLGLRHGASTGLMCLPCEASGARELNDAERRELRRLYESEDR